MKMRELFTSKSTWTQGTMARNSKGKSVLISDVEAVCWCLNGAEMKCYAESPNEYWKVYDKLRDSIGSVTVYNDDKERTFKDIQELVVRLDI